MTAPEQTAHTGGGESGTGRWITIEAERVLYVSRGRDIILCDNHYPGPVTLIIKLPERSHA